MNKIFSSAILGLALTISSAAYAAPSTTAVQQSYIDSGLTALSRKDANNFRDTIGQAHEKNKDLYEQIHQVHEDLHGILTADSFDEDAFLEKSAELRKLHVQIGTNIDEAFANAISNLSDKERMRFADALQASHEQNSASKQ